MKSSSAAAGGGSSRSRRRRLDLRIRIEVMRLAARGRRHPDPAISLRAYEWAHDRLRIPVWQDLAWLAAGAVVGFGAALVMLLFLNDRAELLFILISIAVVGLPFACWWTLYLRRRVEEVARVNRAS